MLKRIRIDIILVIVVTAAITIYALNTTTDYGLFAGGRVGIGSIEEVTEEPEAETEATEESTEEAEETEAPTEEATDEA